MRRLLVTAILGAAVCAPLSMRAAPHSRFTIMDLGRIDGSHFSSAQAINNNGQIAGYGDAATATATHALTWTRAWSIRDLGVSVAATSSIAVGINARGQIVGWNRTGDLNEPVIWERGFVTPLGLPPGMVSGDAVDINTRGDVVGTVTDDPWTGGQHAVLWRNGRVTDLGERFTEASNGYSAGFAINNRGQITGFMREGRAFLWSDGDVIDLGTLPGGSLSIGTDVNDRGQVVGWADNGAGENHAFLWDNGRMIDLGTLPAGGNSAALGINNRGDVVGQADPGRAFLWSRGKMIDLGSLSGGGFSRAEDINERGDVVGVSDNAAGLTAVLWQEVNAIPASNQQSSLRRRAAD